MSSHAQVSAHGSDSHALIGGLAPPHMWALCGAWAYYPCENQCAQSGLACIDRTRTCLGRTRSDHYLAPNSDSHKAHLELARSDHNRYISSQCMERTRTTLGRISSLALIRARALRCVEGRGGRCAECVHANLARVSAHRSDSLARIGLACTDPTHILHGL